jgi:hypothetical protein
MQGKFIAVSAKSIGLNDLSASFYVGVVDFRDQGWVGQIECVETMSEINAACIQHSPHPTITQQGYANLC